MTLDSYNKAKDIVTKIYRLDEEIAELRNITSHDTSKWIFQVREGMSFSARSIDHYGMLPEMLQAILSKHISERKQLVDELEKL